MFECTQIWDKKFDLMTEKEFDEFLEHTEECDLHTAILDKYEADTIPFIAGIFEGVDYAEDVSITSNSFIQRHQNTSVVCMSSSRNLKQRSPEEEFISNETKKILASGFTPENCLKGLKFLEDNNHIVQHSWSNILNKARLFVGIGEKDRAQAITNFVLETFSDSNEAVGSVYEVRSWIKELEYNKGGKVDWKLLNQRMADINQGLKYDKESFLLWANAFEVACLKNSLKTAENCLGQMQRIDRLFLAEYLKSDSYDKEVVRTSTSLFEKIKSLQKAV